MAVRNATPLPAGLEAELERLPPLVTIPEAAALLRAPVTSVRHMLATGRMESFRPGRRVLIARDELRRVLEGGRR